MYKPLSAVFFGAVLGFSACVPLQAATNHFAKQECKDLPTHQLVTTRAFFGTSTNCVDRRYLGTTGDNRQATHYGPAF